MKNKKTLALIGIGAFLIVNDLHNHGHFNKIDKKLDMVLSNQEMIWLNTNELKIDSLNLEIMEIGAKLDSCELVNTNKIQ